MKKKTIILLLVLLIVFVFCACTPPRGELTVTSPQIVEENDTAALPTEDPDMMQATPVPTKEAIAQEEMPTEPEPTEEIDTKDSDLTKELDSTLDEVDALLNEIDEILAMDID